VSALQVIGSIPLKETWNWEAEENNFARLQEEFSQLAGKSATSAEERMEVLDALNARDRFLIDSFARKALLESNPELIDEALGKAEREQKTLKVRLKGGDSDLSGEHFLALLETEDSSLFRYTADGEIFYSIQVMEKTQGWNLLSFSEADRDGTLDEVLDELLMTAYNELKFNEPFEEVSDELGSKVYADLLDKISGEVKNRFSSYLNEMRVLALESKEAFEKKQEATQWPLLTRKEVVAGEGMALEIGEFSPIVSGRFYEIVGKKEILASESEIAEVKEHLKRDAQKQLMHKLLEKM